MVIGFNKQFVEPILNGYKFHTIREDSHNRWKAGMTMHMATGVRTKQYKQFAQKVCTGTQQIEIIRVGVPLFNTIIRVDGRRLMNVEIRHLALADGFSSVGDFLLWFNKGFKGKIIHWTEFRY